METVSFKQSPKSYFWSRADVLEVHADVVHYR